VKRAIVLWFTGLSGSGKTTIVARVAQALLQQNQRVKIFDGDVVRREIHAHLGFTPEDIRENNRLIAELCLKHQFSCDYIFVPIISPFEKARQMARQLLGEKFNLIYCKASLAQVMNRDPKGLYKKALAGKIEYFIGLDERVPYQPPNNAELVLDTATEEVEISANKLLAFINKISKARKQRRV